jgi:hypothetical protein
MIADFIKMIFFQLQLYYCQVILLVHQNKNVEKH